MEEQKTPEAVPAPETTIVSASVPATIVDPNDEPKEMVVVARNPQEMLVAQNRLIVWATRELTEAKSELDDLDKNVEVARKNRWRVATLERAQNRALKRVQFYEKIKGALEAGFVIIPNFEIDIFAIRTKKKRPKANMQRDTGSWANPHVPEQQTDVSPLGKGRYVDADAEVRRRESQIATQGGKTERQVTAWADSFKDVDFPFALAKPEILEATAQAMALKIFDDIGVSPSRHNNQVTRRPNVAGDPMVVGRIILKNGGSYGNNKAVSFLITWFVDTRDIG